jgi:glycosyltransferase involved in cell wall biosynthesis
VSARSPLEDPLAIAALVPAFDAERFLAEALESVLAQTHAAAEILVIDDGSRDGTAAVAARFAGRGVRLIAQENRGPAAARNRCVAGTRAPLLAFLDADDLWPRDHLARLRALLAADPGLDGAVGEVECFASPGLAEADRARLAVPAGPQPGWLPGALLLRRGAWERVGPFDAALRGGGEFVEWVARARARGAVFGRLEAVALLRRVHPASMTVRAREALGRSYLEVARAALARSRGDPGPPPPPGAGA